MLPSRIRTRECRGRAPLAVCATLLLLAAACHDAPTAVREVPPPVAALPTIAVTCSASTRAGTISCGSPDAPSVNAAVRPSLVLGGQGVYVLLTSSHPAYDASTGIFSADVRVRNLTAQQLGTPDGTTVSGIRIFFHSGPSVASGTGTVRVANPDGTSAFTAADQPYFSYPQILQPQDSSAAHQWRFAVPTSVDRFVFEVYVQADLPAEHGVLQWSTALQPLATGTLASIWPASATDIFAVGDGGTIAHFDGTRWSRMGSPVSDALKRVAGRSGTDVFAVGFGGTLHYDGTGWTRQLTAGSLQGLWVSPSTADAFAVGRNGDARHYDGATWTSIPTGTSTSLYGAWGRSPTDVYAVGDGDAVLHWNGLAWTSSSTGTGANLRDVWGAGSADLWVATADGRLLHYDGSHWLTAASTGFPALTSVAGRSANDVYAATADGSVLHYAAGSASTIAAPALVGLRGITMLPNGTLAAVGEQGTIATYDGSRWTVQHNAAFYSAVWGTGASNVFAVNRAGLVAHFDGARWSFLHAPIASPLLAIAGSSASDVYVAGERGLVMRFDGSSWSTIAAATDGALSVVALAAPAAGTLYAATAGDANGDPFDPDSRVLRFDDGTLAASTTGYASRALWAADATTIFAAGDSAQIARHDAAGWTTSLANNSFASLFGIWGSSPTDVFAVGDYTIRHYDGSAWTTTSAPSTSFRAVWGTSPTDVFAVGDGGTIWHFNGHGWLPQHPGSSASLAAVWGTSPSNVYAVGANGTLLLGSR